MERIANNFLTNKNYSQNSATKLLAEVYKDTALLLKELQSCGCVSINNGIITKNKNYQSVLNFYTLPITSAKNLLKIR